MFIDLFKSEDIHEFMLGYDWLVAQEDHWYFVRKILLLHGKVILLKLRTSHSSVSRVYAREQVVVMSNTEQIVLVKLVHVSLRIPRSDWLLEPRTLAEGIYVAHEEDFHRSTNGLTSHKHLPQL